MSMSWVADRYGRRVAILLATALGGICLWPFAYVTNFWVWSFCQCSAHWPPGASLRRPPFILSEMTSTVIRNRVLLASQGVTALVAVSVNLLAFGLIPGHWRIYLWVSAAIEIVPPMALPP